MKRTLLLGACLATLLLAGRAQAQTVTVDGIVYTIDEQAKAAMVTGYEGDPVSLDVAASVGYQGMDYPVTAIQYPGFQYCSALENITLPSTLLVIGDHTFNSCSSLLHVDVPEGVVSISHAAFSDCSALESIALPSSLEELGESVFRNCTSLESIEIPGKVASIPINTFFGCYALAQVTLPEGLRSIGNNAFDGCFALSALELPEGLETIGQFAFQLCEKLARINFPEGLRSIGGYAFLYCTSLESITLPSTLESVGEMAFASPFLTDVVCHAAVPPAISSGTFNGQTYESATLHVPAGTADAYREAEGWKEFQNIAGDAANSISAVGASGESLARYADGVVAASGLAAITVYDANGARVLHAEGVASLSLESLPGGIYVVDVAQGGQRQVLKVAR